MIICEPIEFLAHPRGTVYVFLLSCIRQPRDQFTRFFLIQYALHPCYHYKFLDCFLILDMAKNKKKANADFQKVKLKVGRKLKRDSNETKAEFKSRKIILKEIHGHAKDPITALAHHSEHISQHGKLTLINHFNTALTPSIVKSLNKPIIDSLSKFVIDHSEHVRAATYKCLKTCYNHMKQNQLSLKEFIFTLKPYLDCAYTHIDRGISDDSLRFFDYLTNTNEAQVLEPLMSIVLRRYEAGTLGPKDKSLSVKLKRLYLRHLKRKSQESESKNDNIEPLKWTDRGLFLDLNIWLHDLDGKRRQQCQMDDFHDRDVLLVPKVKAENIVENFLNKVHDEDEDDGDCDKAGEVARPARFHRPAS